jgi:hypothetical protein
VVWQDAMKANNGVHRLSSIPLQPSLRLDLWR